MTTTFTSGRHDESSKTMKWEYMHSIHIHQLQAILPKLFTDCDTPCNPRCTGICSLPTGTRFIFVHPMRKLVAVSREVLLEGTYSKTNTAPRLLCLPAVHLCRRSCRIITALRGCKLLNIKTDSYEYFSLKVANCVSMDTSCKNEYTLKTKQET